MLLLAKIGARGLLSAGVAVLGLLGLGGSSVAQTAQPKAQAAPPQAAPGAPPPPNWGVNCQNIKAGLDCRAGQTLRLGPAGRASLALAVRIPADTKKPVLLIQAPIGIYLPAGVTIQFGQDTAKALPFQICTPAGCLAEYPISEAELAGMQKGNDLTARISSD